MSVTDTSSTQSLSNCNIITIKNVGSATAYISFSTSATTNDFPLDADEELSIGIKNLAQVSAICSSDETTTLKIIAQDTW